MKVTDKIKNKIKNDERFIARMIVAGILAVSVPTFAGGVYACHKAVKDNPTDYANDGRYIAGTVAMLASTTFGTAGVFGSISNNEDENKQEDSQTSKDNVL